jgi:MoaA/NifB/PqqE/SkfB family radical SAM enzyme
MSVRNCIFPWTWILATIDGDVLPCSHGGSPVGNLRENTIDEIWNGPLMRDVRSSILSDRVHPVCRTAECPFQNFHHAFPERSKPISIDREFAEAFDEEWYLREHRDVAAMVADQVFVSGLEQFIRHGPSENRTHRLGARRRQTLPNAILALVEYSNRAVVVEATAVDVVIATSTTCNLRCVMCPHGMNLVEQPRYMPIDLVDRLGSFLKGVSRVMIAGVGEQTISPAFWRIIELVAGRSDVSVRVNTNGHFISEETAERILDSGLTEISFSLDAATPETYRKIRGGNFEQVLAGIGTLVRARSRRKTQRLRILINMVLMSENLAEAPAFATLGRDLGVDAVVLSQLFNFGDRPDWRVARGGWTFVYSDQMIGRRPEDARRCVTGAKRHADLIGMPIQLRENVASYVEGI